jgi:hypothetical protein
MAFSANTLADGVGRCALYLQYGEVNGRKCMLVFRALQERQIVTLHIRCYHVCSFGTDCPWRFKPHVPGAHVHQCCSIGWDIIVATQSPA